MNEIIPSILNEDLLANVEPQQGWVWIPIASGIALIAWIIDKCCDDGKPISICILGQKESGKTTIYDWLKEGEFVPGYKQTNTDDYEEFEYKGLKIAKGQDIGGADTYIYEYETRIKNCDICIFVFDVNKFLNDSAYRQETWVRADLINSECSEHSKMRCTIGTHLDLTPYESDSDKAINQVLELSVGKHCIDMFKSKFVVANLTTKRGFNNCEKQLLKQFGSK